MNATPGMRCFAPSGTPKEIAAKLNAALNTSLADSAVSSALEKAGIDPTPGSTPETTAEFVKAELGKMGANHQSFWRGNRLTDAA